MTRRSLEQSLEECLQELAQTDDVAASLRRCPQYAGQLRPLLEMAQATRRYYQAVPEAPGALVGGRERLLALAAQQRAGGARAVPAAKKATKRASGRSLRFVFAARLIAVLLAGAIVAAVGGGVVWAARDSLPGDLLYKVKLATEDVRLALAPSPAGQVDLALRFVQERAEEMEALAASGQPVPDETIARMERHIERALAQSAWSPEEKMAGLLSQIAERTRIQAQTLERVQEVAPERAQAGLERAMRACYRGAEAADGGLNDPDAFRRRYRHQRGSQQPPDEPVRVTATAASDQGQDPERHQLQDQPATRTPVGTRDPTPPGPQATATAEHTPLGPQATSTPQATPQGRGTTGSPEPTPQGPQAATPQTTPLGPQATPDSQGTPRASQGSPAAPTAPPQPSGPGGGQGGGGQGGGGQGGE